jgi:hypothetical protein
MAAEILLVHGSMLGAWCWDATVAELAALGTEVAAFDLPGHGDDGTPRGSVTVADYVATVVQHLDAATGPVVLAVTHIWPEDDRQNTERRMRMSRSDLPADTRLVTISGDHCAMPTNRKDTAAAIHAVAAGFRD